MAVGNTEVKNVRKKDLKKIWSIERKVEGKYHSRKLFVLLFLSIICYFFLFFLLYYK